MIDHYKLFTLPLNHFLFSRYLYLAKPHFSSDTLVPFPDSSDLYSRDKIFSNNINLHIMYHSNSCIKHLFFSFPSDVFTLSPWFICLLSCSSLKLSVASHFVFHLVSDFLFFVLFWMQWIQVTVNKAIFLLRKTFSKIPVSGTLCIQSTSWKTSC